MMSGRASIASSYEISGLGLANAKTIGFSFIVFTISLVSTPATDKPRNTSDPATASASVFIFLEVAKGFFLSFRSVRCVLITPLESTITIFSSLAPSIMYSCVHELAAAPAPFTTIFTSSIFLPTSSRALIKPAEEIMAVPCWSSCMIGISSSAFSLSSISKHSGAFISSRLIPPKVGAIAFTTWINFSGSFSFTSMSNTSIPANILNNKPLPSITGLPAIAPISPKPSTAVPFEITATRFPLEVYS
ncbi:hypothetical protein SDC9_117536 [bioreactor metagenome]|uniref:Uncharacterized protein n=1 Tax=bioreactor metagenome TaxID=1076179 RepID=A0A645C0Y0_9ZZZZ